MLSILQPVYGNDITVFSFTNTGGFSVCLINIAGYGDFISVIAAPIPMRHFIAIVLRAVN